MNTDKTAERLCPQWKMIGCGFAGYAHVIPHVIALFFLWIGAIIAVIIAWFAILFTGTHPKGIFDYIVGVMRWNQRVYAYALLLTTDEYPPFSLS